MPAVRSRIRSASVAGAAFALVLAAGGCGGAGSGGGTPVTLVVPDKSLTATTASYTSVPIQAGYFDDEKLDVTVQPVDNALSAVQAVATGQAFMTYASTGAAAAAAAKDDGLAVIGLTNGNMFRVVVPEDSAIKEPADLAGKTVGANSLASATALNAKAVVGEAGLAPESDVEYLPVGYGAQAADAMRSGDIDAYSGYDGPNVVIADLLDGEFRDIPSPINDITGTSALVVAKESIENRPDDVAGLARAFFKSMVFAEENPEAAIEMHWAEFPQSKSAEMSDEEALKQSVRIVSARLKATGGEGPDGRFGVQEAADMDETMELFARYKIIPSKVDLADDGILDYSLADSYNKFDADAVREEAASWKQDQGD
ncbi:NitT/TauT family transport system substrate-binding protein [Murinocardiopsis flavida]|uniref:NitT/TauT family transport system substrate-binding protein n=1 Tax=Murinocardiopsis flavida TaxID=645275 RepID=A0A2P8DKE3_9ACTN|nr:ABC transporter substrate-binding protein [Murinocardiopsis flavida]PSK97695.1 NitT/TauT family transport system substrate-binding protein [Murinocardiopsis flavida]